MKFLFITVLLCSFKNIKAQIGKITVKLIPHDCRTVKLTYFIRNDTIRFYRDNKLYKDVKVKVNGFDPSFEVDDFEAGNYTVTYKNMFNQRISRNITIKDTVGCKVNLCLDELDKYNENSIFDKLKNRESAYITCISSGCYNYSNEILIITKKKATFVATYKKKQIVLNAEQINILRNFESILERVTFKGGCTTSDMYSISSKYKKITAIDNSCSWDGFLLLKTQLFNNAE